TRTANVPLALAKGINVALGPDWSIGGSQNLLDEMRYAHEVDVAVWGGMIPTKTLVDMVTVNAAKALGLSAVLGSIEVGKKADVMVIRGDSASPYDALVATTPAEVALVLVDGTVLYGDPDLVGAARDVSTCDNPTICSAPKLLCVAQPGGGDKLD